MDFKIYLTRQGVEGSKQEIRRFTADSDAIINFTYFSEKLYTIFPDLRGKRFEVSWKDLDLDDVLISSNEELQTALSEMGNYNMKKLYVIVYPEYDNAFHKNSSSYRDHLHRGVTCDGCEKSVYGYRYKCIQCPDYDLCSDCEAKFLHPEHYMIRISSVEDGMCGRRWARNFYKLMKKANIGENIRGNCSAKNYSNVQSSSNRETLLPWINFFSNETVSDQCPAMAKEKQKTNTNKSQSSPNDDPSNSTSKNTSEDKRVEFLKYLVENVSQFLDPLGIDFSLQVKPPETATEAEEASASESQSEKANDKPSCSKSESQNENLKDLNKPVEKESQKSNILTKNDTPISRSSEREKESPLSSTENWILIDKDENSTIKDVPVNASNQSNPITESNTNNSSTKKVLYPPLPNVSDNVWHQNPMIQNAVQTMMEMGFSNEGGWLTQLLLSKNGDISKVIDILQPTKL